MIRSLYFIMFHETDAVTLWLDVGVLIVFHRASPHAI